MTEGVPSVPSLVPSLFPLLSNGFEGFPVFRMFRNDLYGMEWSFSLPSLQQQGTVGTAGTRLKQHELGLTGGWN
jgi:hypothetical protein